MAEMAPMPNDRRRAASSLSLDVHPTVPVQRLLRRARSLSLQRRPSILIGFNGDPQETPLVTQDATEANPDDLRITPQRKSLRPAQVHSAKSRARRAASHWPTGKRPRNFELRKYMDTIHSLSSGLDHLINVRKDSRHPANCLCSFFEGTRANNNEDFRYHVLIQPWQAMAKSGGSIFTPQPEDSVRIYFIQDLGASALNLVGSYLQLNPEFFEEHLNRSGYYEASYQDPLPHTWSTHSAEKDYFSVRWFRPVLRNYDYPPRLGDRTELLGEDGIEWDDTTFSKRRDQNIVTHHRARCGTNILRQEWYLSADPAIQDSTLEKSVPCCWEERATVHRASARGDRRLEIWLLDPLPSFVHEVGSTNRSFRSEMKWQRAKLFPYSPPSSRLPPPSSSFFSTGARRGLTFALELSDQLESLRSTHDNLHDWMNHLAGRGDESQSDPCIALLNIVSLDMQGLFRLIAIALDEVSLSSMNDYLLQERLLHWQTFINKIVTELPLTMSSIEGLVHYYFQGMPIPAEVQAIVVKLHQGTEKLVEKTEKCHMSLRADVAILESKRQIAEAESVSRLTELGFIFIPLSFAASAFSMQINELENRAPLSTFVLVCVVLAAVAYSTRLVIRNSFVKRIRRTCFRKARAYGKISPGGEMPARVFVSWLLTWLWNRTALSILVIALTLPICVAPLVVFWIRSPLDVSFKIVLTLLIGPPGLALTWVSSTSFFIVEEDRLRWVPDFWKDPHGRLTRPRRDERQIYGDAPEP